MGVIAKGLGRKWHRCDFGQDAIFLIEIEDTF
jgi:hypothetical protein